MKIMKLAGLAAAGLIAGCGSGVAVAHTAAVKPTVQARPAVTVTHTVTASPARHRNHHPASPPAAAPAPAPAPAANSEAVVDQFYQDITNQDYAAAWALGGSNLAAGNGQSYSSWVTGYATTASLVLGTDATWNGPTVNAELIATQTDGSVRTYQGTYTVIGGVITAASIVRTS
jgi:hypothetical protein